MYYRIFDEETKEYFPSIYNQESKKDIKKEMEGLLSGELSALDVADITGLKWDQFVCKLRTLGMTVEEQPTPFSLEEGGSVAWEEWVCEADEEAWDNLELA